MRQLGKVRQIVEEATGLDITHFYDDLVFIDQGVILIRFDDGDFSRFFLYFHPECSGVHKVDLIRAFSKAAKNNAMECQVQGTFTLTEVPETQELQVELFEEFKAIDDVQVDPVKASL